MNKTLTSVFAHVRKMANEVWSIRQVKRDLCDKNLLYIFMLRIQNRVYDLRRTTKLIDRSLRIFVHIKYDGIRRRNQA